MITNDVKESGREVTDNGYPDFARGERTLPFILSPDTRPDYARGIRELTVGLEELEGPDFARGIRSTKKDTTIEPDFARGIRGS